MYEETKPSLDPGLVVDFGLGVVSETDGQFRFNAEGIFVPRETAVLVRCSLVDTVHGQAGPEDDTPCTLVVFDFQLDRIKATRNIHQAIISLILPEGIQVHKRGLSPAGKVHFDPQAQNISNSTGKSVSAGLNYGGTLQGTLSQSESVCMDTTDYATVTGWTTRHPKPLVNDPRPNNCIKWALLENQARKNGVPPHFRAAVLLERTHQDSPDEIFGIEMDINAKVDLKTAVEDWKMLLGKPQPGSLRISPQGPGTNNLREYDRTRLADQVAGIWKLSSGALETEKFSENFVH